MKKIKGKIRELLINHQSELKASYLDRLQKNSPLVITFLLLAGARALNPIVKEILCSYGIERIHPDQHEAGFLEGPTTYYVNFVLFLFVVSESKKLVSLLKTRERIVELNTELKSPVVAFLQGVHQHPDLEQQEPEDQKNFLYLLRPPLGNSPGGEKALLRLILEFADFVEPRTVMYAPDSTSPSFLAPSSAFFPSFDSPSVRSPQECKNRLSSITPKLPVI